MKKYLLLLLTLVFAMTSYADKVTEQQALQKAQRFFKDKQIVTSSLTRSITRSNHSTSPEDFYVFNAEDNGGFVIISGDNRTPEVLGYADSGKLDLNNLPPNLKGWLEDYSKQIKVLDTSGITQRENTSRAATRTAKAAIEPLITTKWGQGHPYNDQCPLVDGIHCVTGCVATAMAQVMYYHKWPQQACSEIPAYTTATKQIQMNALPPTTFKWDKMRDYYWEGEHGENADAVAELMRYCGQAATMDYDVGASAAPISPQYLIKHFGYSKTAKEIMMHQYSREKWENILYKELSEGRPILYYGCASMGAHEFICDGYDGYGYFHFNWGWEGAGNGFFLLTLFINAGFGPMTNFIDQQSAIIGLQPENGQDVIPDVYGYFDNELTTTEFTRTSSSDNFTNISLMGGVVIQNESLGDKNVYLDYALGLFNGTQLYAVLDHSSAVLNLTNNTTQKQMEVVFGKNLENGVYQIRAIYKLANQDNWETCTNSYANYIIATISDNKLTLRKVNSSSGESRYIVNKVSYSADFYSRNTVEVTVNLTNIGDTNQEMVWFLCKQGEQTWECGFACGTIGPGETGDVTFSASFGGDYGEATLYISPYGRVSNKVWEETVNFEEQYFPHLTWSNVAVNKLEKGILGDSKIHLMFNVTNNESNAFNGQIVCTYEEILPGGSMPLGRIFQYVTLNPGETKQIDFEIPFYFEDGKSYSILCWQSGVNYIPFDDEWNWNNCWPIDFLVCTQGIIEYEGLNYRYSPNSKTAIVMPGEYKNFDILEIPSSIIIDGNSYQVIEIGSEAFKGLYIQSLNLSDGIKSIGSYAFNQCYINKINLPEGLTSVGEGAFQESSLNGINLPSTLGVISSYAFYVTQGVKELSIPEGVVSIGYAAFRECMDLEVLRLPSTLESIGNNVVYNCSKLKYIYLAKTEPITIPEDAFLYMDFSGETPKRIPCPATLLVPEGSVEKYKAAPVWKEFKNIQAFDPTGIKEILMTDGEKHDIYDLQGRKVKAKTTSLDGLPRGVYIINGKKVILK